MVEGSKLEDLEDALVLWVGQVSVKNGTDGDYTHLCLCVFFTSLLCYQSGDCIQTEVCFHTVC
jgi:hypothetical protein